ncbi:MAG: hypothetical protein QXJ97_06370 [Desulfurococcaceae archaeon]
MNRRAEGTTRPRKTHRNLERETVASPLSSKDCSSRFYGFFYSLMRYNANFLVSVLGAINYC